MERRLSIDAIIPQRTSVYSKVIVSLSLAFVVFCGLYSTFHSATVASITLRKPSPPVLEESVSSKAVHGGNISFADYLDHHFLQPGSDSAPHLWLSASDEQRIESGTLALDLFTKRLNEERTRPTHLVVLCMDQLCMEGCKTRGMYCYGGYKYLRPTIMA